MNLRRVLATAVATSLVLVAAACGGSENDSGDGSLRTVKVVLDWTPNTNHTGLYVAQSKGYFAQHGLKVEIVQPGDADASALVAADKVPFGIGYQEALTSARAQDAPLVSLAAIVQHNTSGFASPAGRNLKRPKDYVGKTYGSFGGPIEEPLLQTVVKADGGDPSKIKTVSVGNADFSAATKKGIDFEWIFYGWDGVASELRDEPINFQYIKDYDKTLDFYTPILITNEKEIKDDPELVKSFVAATSEGYTFAAANPGESAQILLDAAPDLNAELVKKSQAWLSPRYQDDAPRWGEQSATIWTDFAAWLYTNKVLSKKVDATKAYTNDFLPAANG